MNGNVLTINDDAVRLGVAIDEMNVTKSEFADAIGIERSGLTKKLSGKTRLTPADYRKIEEKTNINTEWLKTGVGPKFINKIEDGKDTAIQIVRGNPFNGIPFFDLDIACHFAEMYNDNLIPTEFVILPTIKSADFCCRASGHSMEPVIHNNDIVVLKKIVDWDMYITYDEIYAIDTMNDMRTIKLVKKGSSNEYLRLVPLNKEFTEQEILKESIREIFKVVGIFKVL